jgi:excisionase family DNA binding protein
MHKRQKTLKTIPELIEQAKIAPTSSANDAGRLLGVSSQQVYDLAKEGKIASIRIGNCVRIMNADVRARLGL